MDMQSIDEFEELLDKELEEAQEQRRKCEIEERNALKTYRKALRALNEANARCNDLYHRRGQLSASLTVEDSSLPWSARQLEHFTMRLSSPNNMSEFDLFQIPMSSNQIQAKADDFNNLGYDSNIQNLDGVPFSKSCLHVDGQNLGYEPCSEPDATTSELLPCKGRSAANGVRSPSNDPNILAEEDGGTFPSEQESVQPNAESLRKEAVSEERVKETNELNVQFATHSPEDPFLMEANLRSQLVAQMEMRTLLKNSGQGFDAEPAVHREADSNFQREKSQMKMQDISLSVAEKTQQLDVGGNLTFKKFMDSLFGKTLFLFVQTKSLIDSSRWLNQFCFSVMGLIIFAL